MDDLNHARSAPPPYTEQPRSHHPHPYPPEGSTSIPTIFPPYPQQNPPYPSDPHPPFQPQSGASLTVIQVVDVPTLTTHFGNESQFVRCPNCGAQTNTKTDSKVTGTTHLIAFILCCFILWPIAWLPYVCSSCQSTQHYCSNCNQYLGEKTC